MKAKLAQWFVAYVLPFLYEKGMDWLTEQWQLLKVKQAKKKASKEANEKHDAVINNPASSIEEKIRADRDLINNSSV